MMRNSSDVTFQKKNFAQPCAIQSNTLLSSHGMTVLSDHAVSVEFGGQEDARPDDFASGRTHKLPVVWYYMENPP